MRRVGPEIGADPRTVRLAAARPSAACRHAGSPSAPPAAGPAAPRGRRRRAATGAGRGRQPADGSPRTRSPIRAAGRSGSAAAFSRSEAPDNVRSTQGEKAYSPAGGVPRAHRAVRAAPGRSRRPRCRRPARCARAPAPRASARPRRRRRPRTRGRRRLPGEPVVRRVDRNPGRGGQPRQHAPMRPRAPGDIAAAVEMEDRPSPAAPRPAIRLTRTGPCRPRHLPHRDPRRRAAPGRRPARPGRTPARPARASGSPRAAA
jgi:hypothetical protein